MIFQPPLLKLIVESLISKFQIQLLSVSEENNPIVKTVLDQGKQSEEMLESVRFFFCRVLRRLTSCHVDDTISRANCLITDTDSSTNLTNPSPLYGIGIGLTVYIKEHPYIPIGVISVKYNTLYLVEKTNHMDCHSSLKPVFSCTRTHQLVSVGQR